MEFSLAEDCAADAAFATTPAEVSVVADATNLAARPSKRPTASVAPTTPPDEAFLPAVPPRATDAYVTAYPPVPSELRLAIGSRAQELHGLLTKWTEQTPYPENSPLISLLAYAEEIQRAVDTPVGATPLPSAPQMPQPPLSTHEALLAVRAMDTPPATPVSPVEPAATATAAVPAAAHVPAPRSSRRNRTAAARDASPSLVSLLVEFKRGRVKRYDAQTAISPGMYAIVDGDRGTDCGLVIACCVRDEQGRVAELQSIDNCQVDMQRYRTEPGMVRRVATPAERELLHGDIATAERLALSTCRDLVTRMGLQMQVMDCEYQFDRKKISFYFESDESVDFRELNVELYRIYGVRIWLENLNGRVRNVVPDGALSHADKMLYQQSGLRPPRRR